MWLARAEIRLSDGTTARALLARAARIQAQVPDAVVLAQWVHDGWERADAFAASATGDGPALTNAELRVLRLLPSHLSFREIGSPAARLDQHGQDARPVGVPEARCVVPLGRGRARLRRGTDRPVTAGGPDTLAVWRFDDARRSRSPSLPRLERLAREHTIEIEDAALVRWPPRHRKPRTRELGALDGPGQLWGGFWGVLLALIFLTPIAGPRFGAAAGAVAGTLADFGVGDDFVKCVRDCRHPGYVGDLRPR